MVTYIKSDLEFILDQIKIAEAHAAGQPLFGPGGLVPAYTLSFGLRTVDGTYNNLLPGQETWGSADRQFPELLDPSYRPADGTLFDPDGPGPAPAMPTSPNYNPSNNPNSLVFDSSLRTISNLIVDQTLGNPAAILVALERAGNADPMASLPAVSLIYDAFKPSFDAEYQTRVVMQSAQTALNDSPGDAGLIAALATATTNHNTAVADLDAARVVRDAALSPYGIGMDGDNVHLPNIAPDVGLSAPFNSWFTLFGQFFDHGLDLVNKGGSGTVFIPLQPDDPLYVPGSHTNFMVLTRATVSAGPDAVMGTADDVRPVNTTTAFVDQNQTYTSHASHQVFLRQYVLGTDGRPHATGHLIEGGGAAAGGMATWGEVKAQAKNILGIELTDFDVGKVPLLRTDAYGNFIPAANGYPQVILGVGLDGIPNTADDVVAVGTSASPINPSTVTVGAFTGAIRTNMAFLADIAHEAVPVGKLADGDITIGLANPGNGDTEYDNELLDAHFIAGDGRVNENIGLTAVHHIFHSEHNRLAEHTKVVVVADAAKMLADGATQAEAVAFLNEWLAVDVAAVPEGPAVDALVWDGNRLFQAAKFGTEMQYQHLVFEDFARKIQPAIDFFVVPDGYHADINPAIVAEFAHVVYRFGHSMLTEQIDRLDPTFTNDQIGLIQAFLNPVEFDAGHTVADGVAAGDIIRGMTRQVGNEIDEFVTTALRNNLLGLPLDLATINLARGRDTGVPSLNAARREFYQASQNAPELKPYDSWIEFAGGLKNEASVINFIAAYGLHPLITGQTTIEGKRDAAMTIIFNQSFNGLLIPADRVAFLNGTGAWANLPNGVTTTGIDNIDLWIGGLAEKIMPFGGMLGATFNFVFEVQLEKLQDGDRFYYLQRLDGLHLLAEMENNTFAKLISKNADAGHLPSDVFSTPGLILEVDQTKQWNPGLGAADPTGGGILVPLVSRDNPATPGSDTNYLKYTGDQHVLLGGTDGDDVLVASEGDDTLYGDAGDDRMEGGFGNDQYIGGDGDDIITDIGGDDIIRSGGGNDAINAGPGTDLVVSEAGQDFVVLGADMLDEVFAGLGNDFVLGSKTTEQTMGGEGDDWIEIGAWTGAVGDNFDDQFAADSIKGHDVFHGDGGFDEFIGEGGDDIWVGSLGRGKFDGMSGFDWATYTDLQMGINADLFRLHFDALPLPPSNSALDEYAFVEGVSGSHFNDEILGSDVTSAEMPTEGARGSVLDAEGIALIDGLQEVVGAGVTSFDAGNILLGGGGSDVITGRGGDDIIDGDKWLNVRISVREFVGPDGGFGAEIDSANSMKDLVTEIFNGTYNPGQLQTVREILKDDGVGDTDVAVFSDLQANYDITGNPDGTITVAHARGTLVDGTDTVSNIEVLRFSDGDLLLTKPVVDLHAFDVAGTYADDFPTNATTPGYGNSTGTTAWGPDWIESDDGANNATTGQITLTGGDLRFATGDGATITRTVPLAGAAGARLTYAVEEIGLDGGGDNDNVVVQFSSNGTTGWTTVGPVIDGATGNTTRGVDLPGPFTATSAIRFVSSSLEAGDQVEITSLSVEFTVPAPADGLNFASSFTENGPNAALSNRPGITDNGPTLASAKIVLTNAQNGDALEWTPANIPAGITATLDLSVEGQIAVLLTGTATLAAYQTAIQAVSFDNDSENPGTIARIVHVTANDGFVESDPAVTTITVTAVNDVPLAGDDDVITNFDANTTFLIPEWALLANDLDPEGAPLDITAVGGPIGLASGPSLVTNPGFVTLSDNTTANGSFTYTLSDGVLLDSAGNDVNITRDTTPASVTGNNNANIMIGDGDASVFDSSGGNDIVLAGGGADTIDAGTGDDRIMGEAGLDTIVWNANTTGDTDGFDMVDGGSESDTFDVNTRAGVAETYRVYTRAAAEAAGIAILGALTEIVITRQAGASTLVIAELDNIEEIRIGTQTADPTNGSAGGTPGDSVQIFGDFSTTSLALSTITIEGTEGDDVIDISNLTSAHRIVFKSNGGHDTIVGDLRPQDVIELPTGTTTDDFDETVDGEGMTTLTDGETSINYHAPEGSQVVDEDDEYEGEHGDDDDEDEDDEDDHHEDEDDEDEDEDDDAPAPASGPIVGTPQDDILLGTSGGDLVFGLAGVDYIVTGAGPDVVRAGGGNDFIDGEAGRDVLFGEDGDDDMFGGGDDDMMYGGAGGDRMFGQNGNDLLDGGEGNDSVFGGNGNDLMVASLNDGNDTYYGGDISADAGNDTLDMGFLTVGAVVDLGTGVGGRGSAVSSESGTDTLWGVENVVTGSGNDTITMSNSVNVVDGGQGEDVFVFGSATAAHGDTIRGFQAGDKIDLSGIDANTGAAGNDTFTLESGQATTAPGQIVVTHETLEDGEYTVISGNTTGNDNAPEFRISIAGNHDLMGTDFNL